MGEVTGMYEMLEALEETLKASNPKKREELAKTLDAYSEDFPEEFRRVIGAQSPALLHNLVMTIDMGCRDPEAPSRPRGVIRLVHRKSEGNA
jgi:hypothetical protein